MKKSITSVFVSLFLLVSLVGCGESTKTLTGTAKGFAGEVKVTVKVKGDNIVGVVATGEYETPGIGTLALDEIPNAIVMKNSTDVDVVATATVTSKAIMNAVNNALDPEKYPYVSEDDSQNPIGSVTAASVYQGFGLVNTPRMGPGKDDKDVPVYSINQVFANVLFDEAGKILAIYVDQLEYATPNYDGDKMPHFSGFPGQGGYHNDSNHDGKVDGTTTDSEDNFIAELAGWQTKRDRGSSYVMGTGTWAKQMDTFQRLFVGMSVEEVEQWFAKNCSDLNGRPLKANSDKPEDKAKYDKLTDAEKAILDDVVTGATMSLNDSHGNIIAAIKEAFDTKVGLDIEAASFQGFGLVSSPRMGPGKDDKDVPVYSVNQVFAHTLFDANGKIVAILVDQLEYATPNYDGDKMPHFSGFPGQGGYNNDSNHDGKVDGTTTDSEDNLIAELAGWQTKRDRGSSYVMGTGTWAKQMDTFQRLFVGMSVEEVEQWFAKNCSDLNGRPLKANSDKPEDKAKYDKLTDAEKAILDDVVTGATMSLNDSHGNIIKAIKLSFEKKVAIDLTVK